VERRRDVVEANVDLQDVGRVLRADVERADAEQEPARVGVFDAVVGLRDLLGREVELAGYFEDPESTARAIDADGWLRTGDEGFSRMDGGRPVYFVTGRLKELIIRDAEKYSPLRLERALVGALPELSGLLVVLGFSHREHGEEVGAYVQIDPLDEPLRAKIADDYGSGCGQGPAGGIVDLDIPAAKLTGNTSCQISIGCHERRALAWLLEGLAHA
jgi:acyl-CoA synthetase (AMP-forming)/AMP-acid ligase II